MYINILCILFSLDIACVCYLDALDSVHVLGRLFSLCTPCLSLLLASPALVVNPVLWLLHTNILAATGASKKLDYYFICARLKIRVAGRNT